MTVTNEKERKNLIICIILAASNQFCGINAIIFYAKQLFMRVTDNNNTLSQVIIIFLGIVQIIATFIGGKMMDKWSKRYFLFAGELSMVFILAFIFIFNQNIPLVVTLIFTHTIAYSFSIGQLLLFYASKMLDSTGNVVMANWFATFLVAISAEYMMKIMGIGKMCLLFSILLAVCLIFLWNSLPTDK